jgi:thiol-disulfide isomerase/thioredoxin
LLEGHAGDQYGEVHDLASLAEGFLVVDFAASWCEPCYEALPRIEALAQEHPKVRFIIVSVDETEAGRALLVDDLGLELPVLWDEGQQIVEAFSPVGFPATFVLEQGRVIYQHIGSDPGGWQELVAVLGRLDP